MEMKGFAIALMMSLTASVIAHDGGHGPKITEAAKNGGVVAPVIKTTDLKSGAKATVQYKAELVRSDDGTVMVYLFDSAMKPLPLTSFEKNAKADLEYKKKGKWVKLPFELTLDGETYKGKAPTPPQKPFNIDIHLNDGKDALLVAFDRLD